MTVNDATGGPFTAPALTGAAAISGLLTTLTLTGAAAISGLLTGPARMTQRDQVAAIGAAIGKDLTVTALTRDEALAQFARFMPSEDPRLRLTPPAGHPGRSSF